jgi:DNA recombination protein RmuC
VNVIELVMAVALIAALLAIVWMLAGRRRPGDGASEAILRALADIGSLKSHVGTVTEQQGALAQSLQALQSSVQGVETRVLESSASVRDAIGKDLSEARLVVERLKVDAEERRRIEDDVQASARRIETVLLGSRTRGAAGENILQDAFRQFPPEMIDMNFRVNGKVVEYALVLANGKRLPIDSKWPSPELLERLTDSQQDPARETVLVQEIERVLRLKVRDVRQYIDPGSTLAFAVAAVPDPVFGACRRAHLEAYREGVILMPYSMTIPYVLALFRLHLQYARSIDLENLEGYLQQIDDNVAALDRLLENSIARGSTMIQNAFNDAKRNLGQMRGALAALRAVPQASLVEESESPRLEDGDLALLFRPGSGSGPAA